MRTSTLLALLCLISAGLRAALPADKDPTTGIVLKPGTYSARWIVPRPSDSDMMNVAVGNGYWLESHRPSNLRRTPQFKSKHPLFANIAALSMVLALDESGGTGKGYDTLYLDTNRDLDLKSHHPCQGRHMKDRDGRDFVAFMGAATLPYSQIVNKPSGKQSVALDVWVSPLTHDTVEARLRGCWIGKADSNKGKIPFLIQDWNLNGKFGDAPHDRSAGDVVRFDWQKNGGFENEFSYYPNHYLASSVAEIGGHLVNLRSSSTGDRLAISTYTGPTGKLALNLRTVGNTKLKPPYYPVEDIASESGRYELRTDGQPVTLPTGRYWLRSVTAQASSWDFDYEPFQAYSVEAGKTTRVTVGGKVTLQIAPGEKSIVLQRGKTSGVPVPTLLPGGQAVVRHSDYMLPVVKLIDSSGKVVYKGNVNRRDYWLRDLGIIPMTLKPGTYTMKVTVDVGPFGGKLSAARQVVVR